MTRGLQTAHSGFSEDTETPVGDLQVPQVDSQIVCGHVGLVVAVDGDGVDVVGVCVGEHPPRSSLHHQVHGPQHGDLWQLGVMQRGRGGEGEERERRRITLPTGHVNTCTC